jgi:hypothetical protein
LLSFPAKRPIATVVFPSNPEKCAKPGPKGLVDMHLFRGLKPPAPSGIYDLQLPLFRGLKPPAPSGIYDLQLHLFRGLKPPAPSGIYDLQLWY